ncbi:MAG: DinB family protein [Actinomycetota bacterium]
MNEALLEAFRHHVWATGRLVEFCGELPEDRLRSTAAGTYGDILATLNHLVASDGSYLLRLAGSGPAWAEDQDESADLSGLRARIDELAPLWEELLSRSVDAERVIVVDRGANEVRAGVFVAQALHHGNAHREQVCAILTGLGIEPPDVQAWEYAWATGRLWKRPPGA